MADEPEQLEMDADGHPKLFLEGELGLEKLGFGCKHHWEAVKIAKDRVKQLLDADADETVLEREIRASDPAYQMYLFVGMQHSAHIVFWGVKEMWRRHRTNILSLPLLGSLPPQMVDADWVHNTIYVPMAQAFERTMAALLPKYLERMQHIHDSDHNLVPWDYPALDVPRKADPTKPVDISPDEEQRVAKLLFWGGEGDDA